MKNVFLIHGSYGSPAENWFPWMKNRVEGLGLPAARLNDVVGQAALAKEGYRVFVPQFPTPEGQSLDAWRKAFEIFEDSLDSESVLVAHSLGSAFCLDLLEKYQVKACFFVSAFINFLDNPEFDDINKTFVQRDFDWEKIKANCPNFTVFHSDNDPYVPLAKGREVAEKLDAEFILIPNAGHFNQAAGYTEFPELLARVKEVLT